jgi:large subunit ribosomal protein L15
MPLTRRVPKRGFSSPFKKKYEVVNIGDLSIFESGSSVDPGLLKEKGLIKKTRMVKILGKGILDKPLRVKAHLFSREAEKKIRASGGEVEVIKC